MELAAFGHALESLKLVQIRALAADIHSASESTADQIAATRALLGIEWALRRTRRQHGAALAALAAATAVQEAAARDGASLPDDDVTCVARSAAQLARALVAGDAVTDGFACLARGWHHFPGVLAQLTAEPSDRQPVARR